MGLERLYHLYPQEKGHYKRQCLCIPKRVKICNCDIGEDCWKCNGEGNIEIHRKSDYTDQDMLMLIHNSYDSNYNGKYILLYPSKKKIVIDA